MSNDAQDSGKPRRCEVCGASVKHWNEAVRTCRRMLCREVKQSGKTIDALVREASQIPKDIPHNNNDERGFSIFDE